MDQQTITVLGGTGFLGSAIVRRLAAQSENFVRIAARKPEKAAFADLGDNWEPVVCDVRDEDSVARAVSGADAVVNAVSLYVEKGALSFDAIHVEGAGRIARCARSAGVEDLVHVSGIGVSSNSPSAYIRARSDGEDRVKAEFPDATILRPSAIGAPGGGIVEALETVTRLPVVPLFGRGRMRMQPVSVADVARAVDEVLANALHRGRVFELGGGEIYTYREAVEAVMRYHGRRRLIMPFPMPLWHVIAALLSVLPNPPLTRDQLYLLQNDNVAGSEDAGTFADLGLEPESLPQMLQG